jgi:hypothetical protein
MTDTSNLIDAGEYGTVYMCQPSYGPGHRLSKRQFWGRVVAPGSPYAAVNIMRDDEGSSLLADSFNMHWRNALNLQLAGVNVSRFFMLHDDCVPEDDYLTKLLAVLDETKADLVSAVVAIKDRRDLTSTALDDPDDAWEVWRRLTKAEVAGLPDTFDGPTASRALEPFHGGRNGKPAQERSLLANTGCWVCDFTRPWRRKVQFEIKSRIIVAGQDRGKAFCIPVQTLTDEALDYLDKGVKEGHICYEYKNQVMPEDWDFSRQLARLGALVVCTKRIGVAHMGAEAFITVPGKMAVSGADKPFAHDEDLRRKWDPACRQPIIDGWISHNEGRALARLAEGKRVLEIGAYLGLSTVWMARTALAVVSIDPHDGRATPRRQDTFEQFQANLKVHGVDDRVTALRGTSREMLDPSNWRDGEPFGMAFIDGAHDEESVLEDFALVLPKVADGGLICFHDYSGKDMGVVNAVNRIKELHAEQEAGTGELRLDRTTMKVVEQVGTLAVFRVSKPGQRVPAGAPTDDRATLAEESPRKRNGPCETRESMTLAGS